MRFAGSRVFGGREFADAITQEAFLKAIASLDTFRAEAGFRTWITRIALNLALNERRKKRPAPMPQAEMASAETGPATAAGDREIREIVAAAVEALPAEYREALLLTFYGGCSHAEAGRILGVAEGTVSWRVFTAKAKLREVLPDGL